MAAELHTEGLQHFLELANGEQSKPANYYMRACEDAYINEDGNLAGLTELSGNGYAAVAVASNGSDLVSSGAGTNDRKLTTKVCRFTADGGAWETAKTVYLATTSDNTGKLIASAPLNGGDGWTLSDGQYFEAALVIQLNG
jgi:hypothetical protein